MSWSLHVKTTYPKHLYECKSFCVKAWDRDRNMQEPIALSFNECSSALSFKWSVQPSPCAGTLLALEECSVRDSAEDVFLNAWTNSRQ